jgi:hypothetical protein
MSGDFPSHCLPQMGHQSGSIEVMYISLLGSVIFYMFDFIFRWLMFYFWMHSGSFLQEVKRQVPNENYQVFQIQVPRRRIVVVVVVVVCC